MAYAATTYAKTEMVKPTEKKLKVLLQNNGRNNGQTIMRCLVIPTHLSYIN